MPFPLIAAIAASAPTWLPAVATVGSAAIGALGAQQAGRMQQQGIDTATGEIRRQFDETRGLLGPSIAAGDTARGYQLGALGLPGGVSYEDALRAFHTSPGYDFARRSGIGAAQGSAAAGGTLFSGRTLKDLTRFGTGLADQEFGNWYDRLGGLSGTGVNAAGSLASGGQTAAGRLADLAVGAGEARGSSYAQSASHLVKGAQNLANLVAYQGRPYAPMTYQQKYQSGSPLGFFG